MSGYVEIPLNIQEGRIKFLVAEVPMDFHNPFGRIRYSVEGVRKEDGLRLDLGKRVFIDHFENPEDEEILQAVTPRIVEIISEILG